MLDHSLRVSVADMINLQEDNMDHMKKGNSRMTIKPENNIPKPNVRPPAQRLVVKKESNIKNILPELTDENINKEKICDPEKD